MTDAQLDSVKKLNELGFKRARRETGCTPILMYWTTTVIEPFHYAWIDTDGAINDMPADVFCASRLAAISHEN